MSYFGKNIRKIRTLKKLSQSDFAQLFELNRGNISAYEEERSEAKVDTIIAIANHFSISVDDLLSKELTIDDIYHIDKLREQHLSTATDFPVGQKIRFISAKKLPLFFSFFDDESFLANLPHIQVVGFNDVDLIAIEVNRELASLKWNIEADDIIIIRHLNQNNKLGQDSLYLFKEKKQFFIDIESTENAYTEAFEIIGMIKIKINTFYNQLIRRIERLEFKK